MMTIKAIPLTFLTILFSVNVYAQTVSTFLDSAQFKVTDAVIFDPQGNLYGADYSGNAVYKITPTGVISTVISGLGAPNGLAFDSMGNLFVCDNTGNKIYKVAANGTVLDTIAVSSPSGIIKQAGSDTMIFTTYTGHKLVKLAPDGTMTNWFDGVPLVGPVGLAYDDLGKFYVSNFTDRRIYEVTQDSLIYVARVPGTNSSSLGFIAYANQCLWATSFQNHKIYRVYLGYTDSVVLYSGTSVGSVDGPLLLAKFNRPNGIAAKGDSLYISEYGTGKVRIIAGISLGLRESASLIPFHLYPNPAHNSLILKLPTEIKEGKWSILDQAGRILNSGHMDGIEMQMDISAYPTGTYFLELTSKEYKYRPMSFIKN